jgi:hypothetical protein
LCARCAHATRQNWQQPDVHKHWSVTLSGLNLTDTRYFQYDLIKPMPANRYYNGTLYLASLHFKL